jgi:hypothetical protein
MMTRAEYEEIDKKVAKMLKEATSKEAKEQDDDR